MSSSQNLVNTVRPSRTSSPRNSPLFWAFFASNALLSIFSITNLALLGSVVAWLLRQKHHAHSYLINWPANPTQLNVLPQNLWVDHGHETNGVAGYGFFLGIFGMITAWRLTRTSRSLKSVAILAFLQTLAVFFTLSALIFTFIVTSQTQGQQIREPVASNTQGANYAEYRWTPETWMKAVLDLPLADGAKRNEIHSQVNNMVASRWMLLIIFMVDVVSFGTTGLVWWRQRLVSQVRRHSGDMEKYHQEFL